MSQLLLAAISRTVLSSGLLPLATDEPSGGGGLGSVFIGAIRGAIKSLSQDAAEWIQTKIKTLFSDFVLSTPVPQNYLSFSAPPADSTFGGIYAAHNQILILSVTLFGLILGLALFFNIFDKTDQALSLRRAFFAFPVAISSWWIGAWFLKLNAGIVNFIVSQVGFSGADAGLGGVLTFGADVGIIGGILYFAGAGIGLITVAIFMIRWALLHAYMAALPLLFVLTAAPIDSVSGLARGILDKFVPLAALPIPVAFLFSLSTTVSKRASETGDAAESFLAVAFLLGALLVPIAMFPLASAATGKVTKGLATAGAGAVAGAKASQVASGANAAAQAGQAASSVGSAANATQQALQQQGNTGAASVSYTALGGRRASYNRGAKLGQRAAEGVEGLKTGAGALGATAESAVDSGMEGYYRGKYEHDSIGAAGGTAAAAAGSTVAEAAGSTAARARQMASESLNSRFGGNGAATSRLRRSTRRLQQKRREYRDQYAVQGVADEIASEFDSPEAVTDDFEVEPLDTETNEDSDQVRLFDDIE